MDEKESKPAPKTEGTEESLVKEYTKLTGASETDARCVLMHLNLPDQENKDVKDKKPQADKPAA